MAWRRGPAWIADAISAIEATGDAIVVGLVEAGPSTNRTTGLGRAFLRAYGWLDARVFGRPDDPTRIVDITAPTRPEEPDVVIRFDGAHGSVSRWPAPALGVWTLAHGMGLPTSVRIDPLDVAPGGPEMLLSRPFTISQIVACTGADQRAIGQVVSRVDPLSLRRGTRGHLRKLPGLVARTVTTVRAGGGLPDPIVERAIDAAANDRARLGSTEIAWNLVRILLGFVYRLVKRKIAPTRWVVAVSRDHDDPRGVGGTSFRFLDSPGDREWADPFPLRTPGADYLFIEEYVFADHRGHLSVVELDDSPRGWRSVDSILALPTHLSYPFVFEWLGAWYMLPEQGATGGSQLYIADEFPRAWRWHSTALDRPVADATIVEIEGRWWMFSAIAVSGGSAADEMHLFHAETPLGPWTAHARNPVVSDVRTARAAGRIFERDGAWYRVAQDGAIEYGHSIALVRIDRLDLDGYRETVVDKNLPDWATGLLGTHTLNRVDGLTAIDGSRARRRSIR